MADRPKVGDAAPDFELPSTKGTLRLKDLTGTKKVLLAFYTEDNTPLCSSEVSVLTEDYELVQQLRTEVVAVSADSLDSHVDFTTLRQAGEEAGLQTLGLASQSEFLANLGIAEALAPLGEGDVNLEEYYARRRAVSELIDPAALGRIRVLVQAKGVGHPRLTGLEGGLDG